MNDQQSMLVLAERAIFLGINGYLWHRANTMKLEFEKTWYPIAVMVLCFFFPVWSLVGMVLCILNAVDRKLKGHETLAETDLLNKKDAA